MTFQDTYLGHDWLSVFIRDIAERHFRAFVLVNPDLGIVDKWNLIKGYCEGTR